MTVLERFCNSVPNNRWRQEDHYEPGTQNRRTSEWSISHASARWRTRSCLRTSWPVFHSDRGCHLLKSLVPRCDIRSMRNSAPNLAQLSLWVLLRSRRRLCGWSMLRSFLRIATRASRHIKKPGFQGERTDLRGLDFEVEWQFHGVLATVSPAEWAFLSSYVCGPLAGLSQYESTLRRMHFSCSGHGVVINQLWSPNTRAWVAHQTFAHCFKKREDENAIARECQTTWDHYFTATSTLCSLTALTSRRLYVQTPM